MHRLFETSPGRYRIDVPEQWEFVTDPDDEGRAAGYPESFPQDPDTIPVPCAWNAVTRYHQYEGAAWYRTTVTVPERSHLELTFQGVANEATVYVDGDEVASHYGGYTPFGAVLPAVESGAHELVLRVDNTRDETSVPSPGSDWPAYGGITREVTLETLPDLFVEDVAVQYELDEGTALIDADVEVRNLGDEVTETVGVEIGDHSETATVKLPQGSSTHSLLLTVEDIDLWSPDDPVLYRVDATVGTDKQRDRIGFRDIEVDGREIRLNGEPIEFRGVNRYEDHPEWGHTQPARLMDLDIELIQEAGLNAVRTAHYPNHPRFLDYCDEAGLLVIEAMPFSQFDGEDFHRGPVLDRGETMVAETIERDRHHPSVLAWSVTNECENSQEAVYDATERLVDVARERDPCRPVTFATWEPDNDDCVELCDFICVNGYPDWYEGYDSWDEQLARVEDEFPDMPIVVGEFGAGAIYGERTRERQKWSEGYQADLLEDAIETIEAREAVAGFVIWEFCDTRSDSRREMDRPKTKNNKGIVDEYRRPKEAYWAVADLLTEDSARTVTTTPSFLPDGGSR
jgi:beta-glucuronidase